MPIFSKHNFVVIAFSPGRVSGCSFRHRRAGWKLERFASENVINDDPGTAWRNVLRSVGCWKGTPLVVSGALKGGIFFTANSVGLPEKDRRSALEFELSRYLPQPPPSPRLQFFTFPPDENGDVRVNVYAFDASALDKFSELVSLSNCRPDEFCFPLIGVNRDEPAVALPEIEPDFYFHRGEWHPVAGASEELEQSSREWGEIFARCLELPDHPDFRMSEHLAELLTARMLISEDFHFRRIGLRVVPDRLRPVRYRRQLVVAVVLLLLIGAVQLLGRVDDWRRDYQDYRAAVSERNRIKRETSQIRDQLRRQSKELREQSRVVSINPGEYEAVASLAEISAAIPEDVLTASARWSESGIELLLLGTAESGDPAEYLGRLKNWKIDQLQQRQGGGSSVVSSTVKLIRLSDGGSEKGGK